MNTRVKRIVFVGLALCLAFGVVAPFVASSNPDGLDNTAQDLLGEDGLSAQEQSYHEGAPFPDYAVPPMGDGASSSALALVVGVLAMFIVAWAVVALVVRGRGN